jgi:hypothetical protein
MDQSLAEVMQEIPQESLNCSTTGANSGRDRVYVLTAEEI